jgi:GAF domain-containing protein
MVANKKDRLEDIDRMLAEVREMLGIARDAGDINELVFLQILLQVTKELHSITNVYALITKVLDSALAFANGERSFIMLLDENGEPRFKMGRDGLGNYLTIQDFSPSSTVIDHVLENGRTVIVPDAMSDDDLSKRESVQQLALRTIICSPLVIKRQTIGLLYVDSSEAPISAFNTRAQLNFLGSLADQSAVAIHNAQKFETQQ